MGWRSWEQIDPVTPSGSLIIYDSEKALKVNIKINGSGFEIQQETINEDVIDSKKPTRIGINLTEPVTHAFISLKIRPKE